MTSVRIQEQQDSLRLRFGFGVNSSASEDAIDPGECTDGQNCLLALGNEDMVTRPPFDLVGTVPNAGSIAGLATLRQRDGTVTMLVQAGDTVYSWDGSSFTSVGTVAATAKLRGPIDHHWQLDDVVLITDLSLTEPVQVWDGTTLTEPTFVSSDPSGSPVTPFGVFFARYCTVNDERAFFAHVRDQSQTTRHMIVGSARSEYTWISVTDVPSSALSESDPFFVLTPDLRDVNGLIQAFGITVVSSLNGRIFQLTGASAKDFAFEPLFQESGARGDESVVYVGDDIFYGREGRIESLRATDSFGDVEADDVTRPISDLVESVLGWTLVYNRRLRRLYAFPSGSSEAWTYFKPLQVTGKSPWMPFRTRHPMAFMPTAVMSCYDPVDGLEYVFMGDSSGNLYRLEGTYGSGGDGGDFPILSERLSALFDAGLDARAERIDGWLRRRVGRNIDAVVALEYAGFTGFRVDSRTIALVAPETGAAYYGGTEADGDDFYYGGTEAGSDAAYYGAPGADRFLRDKISFAGSGEDFQIRVSVDGDLKAQIGEVGLRYRAKK